MRLLAISALVLGLVACQGMKTADNRNGGEAPKNVMPVPGSRAGTGNGAVLFVAQFNGIEARGGEIACRWRVINQESKKSFFLNVKAGDPNVFAQLDPGTYQTGRLGCGISKVWDLENVFKDGFTVEASRVSYIGKLVFEFKNGGLDTVRKATRSESAQAFVKAQDSTPAGGMEAINGFTARPINKTMIDTAEGRDGFDVFAKGIDNAQQQLASLVTTLKDCSNAETAVDPLRFGRLEYTAVYKQGRFSEMKTRDESNSFSDRLRSCVERGMMAYHPTVQKEVEVRVRY